MLLKDRVAIITGGSMGIGKGIAVRFADEDCSVVIADISDSEGQKTVEEISKKGGKALFINCDVTDSLKVENMIKNTVDNFGKVDILVNSAGGIPGFKGEGIEHTSNEMWDKIVNLNLKGVFFCCRAVVLPGPVRTPFWKPVTRDVEDIEEFFKHVAEAVPLQRVGTPEDLGGAALFYASDLSSYVTGDRMYVSGGIPLTPLAPED
ncbi:MAG: SDR family oxidoreductase [Dehalococcoidia bacterium]